MSTGLALELQLLATVADRVLTVAQVAGLRAGDRWFRPGDITELFDIFRVPKPGNVSQTLVQLERRGFVTRRSGGGAWSLTPLGEERVNGLIGAVDARWLDTRSAALEGAVFSDARHTLLPPSLAPGRWLPAISRLTKRSSFDRNVFLMTRFPDGSDPADPLPPVITGIREAAAKHGLMVHLATDQNADDELHGNIAAYMWACKYGIAIFERRTRPEVNHNVGIEVGSMFMTGRRCALLKDISVDRLPTDLVGHIYKDVDLDSVSGVVATVHEWFARDLGLGACAHCPPDALLGVA
jgi:hypothetical protein